MNLTFCCSEHAKFVTLVNEEVSEDVEEGYSDEGGCLTRLNGFGHKLIGGRKWT